MSKKDWERRHTKRRVMERYGLTVNRCVRIQMVKQIQKGTGKFVERRSKARTVWYVKIGNDYVKVVYDKDRHEILTALPQKKRFEDHKYKRERWRDGSFK
jgi:hypothetical protein